MELNTTLLRERFFIRDRDTQAGDVPESVEALSNRLVVPLVNRRGEISEVFVIRSRIMHSAVRMAAQITQAFMRSGPVMLRGTKYSFEEAWQFAHSRHDEKYCDDPWICIYHEGKPVFASGNRHPFLDIIEKCDTKNPGNYDNAVMIAEETFKRMGREVSISHNSNIGLVAHIKEQTGRCGMILRNPHKSTTFNFIADQRTSDLSVTPYSCLNCCAAFLEGIQLSVRLGMNNEKIRQRLVSGTTSSEAQENISALARLRVLNEEIENFESLLDVHYRPERPDFPALAKEAEAFQAQLLMSA